MIIEWVNNTKEIYDDEQVSVDYVYEDEPLRRFATIEYPYPMPRMEVTVNMGYGIKKTGLIKKIAKVSI